MNASLPFQPTQGKADGAVVVKPYQSVDWPVLWQLRACQLAEQGIMVDAIDIVPCRPDLNSPYERDYHRMKQVYLSSRGNFWIAWITDQPVGHIGAQDLEDYIELRRLYVRDVFRRAGIGTQLVSALLAHSKEHDVRLIKLWTDPTGPGRSLYRNFGFLEVDDPNKRGDFVRDPSVEIRMALALSE